MSNCETIKIIYIVLIVYTISGCLIVPSFDHTVSGQHLPIEEEIINKFTIGETTLPDVLLQLGAPNKSFDDRYLIYIWNYLHGGWTVFGGAGTQGSVSGGSVAVGGQVYSEYYLCIEFAPESSLNRIIILKNIEASNPVRDYFEKSAYEALCECFPDVAEIASGQILRLDK